MLPVETSGMMINSVAAISTITWYQGDIHDVRKIVRDKVSQILDRNPWIAGRLATRNGEISIVYDPTSKNLEATRIFTCCGDSKEKESSTVKISRSSPYQDLQNLLEPLLVKKSFQLLDKDDEPFFRVSLVPDSQNPKGRFALITSLAHCVGDGHTYYALHNMLSEDQPLVALNVQRKPEIPKLMEEALGGEAQASALSDPSPGFLFRFVTGILTSLIMGPPTSVKLFWINEEWLQEKKRLGSAQLKMHAKPSDDNTPSFVSTNDILTAQCFKSVECDQGIMAMNFRGKIPNCLETDAGCYFNYLTCRPDDYASASDIRLAVHEIQSPALKRRPRTEPMTSWEHFQSRSLFGALSNWSTFSKPVKLGSVQQELHLPVLPTDAVSCPSRAVSGIFAFKPSSSPKVAVMYAGHPRGLKALEASGMVGRIIE